MNSSTRDETLSFPRPNVLEAGWRSRAGQLRTGWWCLTLVCACVAIGLVVVAGRLHGPLIVIRFAHGHGIKPGDRLRHAGIEVGEVSRVQLNDQLDGAEIHVQLQAAAAGLARQGSQFWIERLNVSLAEVRGLDTLFAGQYLAVLPGSADGPLATEFDGLPEPPAGDHLDGGIEFVLEGPDLVGLSRGVPITYRGVRVGHVVSVGLTSDGAAVEARGFVQPAYRNLVRENSRFWSKSGLDLSLGLSGLRLDADTLSNMALGGVAFVTLDPPGRSVATGHRFALAARPESGWLTAQPRIAVGAQLLPEGRALPQLIRALRSEQQRFLGFQRTSHRYGWLLPLDDQRLLGPADMLVVATPEADSAPTLELDGRQLPVSPNRGEMLGELALYTPEAPVTAGPTGWPRNLIRHAEQVEDCVVVTAPNEVPIPLAAIRLTTSELGWNIEPSLAIGVNHHGACVVAVRDGCVVGIVISNTHPAHVALVGEIPTRAEADVK